MSSEPGKLRPRRLKLNTGHTKNFQQLTFEKNVAVHLQRSPIPSWGWPRGRSEPLLHVTILKSLTFQRLHGCAPNFPGLLQDYAQVNTPFKLECRPNQRTTHQAACYSLQKAVKNFPATPEGWPHGRSEPVRCDFEKINVQVTPNLRHLFPRLQGCAPNIPDLLHDDAQVNALFKLVCRPTTVWHKRVKLLLCNKLSKFFLATPSECSATASKITAAPQRRMLPSEFAKLNLPKKRQR